MSHKKIAIFAVVMVVVFGSVIILYPMLYSPNTPTLPAVGEPGPNLPSGH